MENADGRVGIQAVARRRCSAKDVVTPLCGLEKPHLTRKSIFDNHFYKRNLIHAHFGCAFKRLFRVSASRAPDAHRNGQVVGERPAARSSGGSASGIVRFSHRAICSSVPSESGPPGSSVLKQRAGVQCVEHPRHAVDVPFDDHLPRRALLEHGDGWSGQASAARRLARGRPTLLERPRMPPGA